MEKKIFRDIMKHKVIQKTIIFADVFNLRIDGWRPENSLEHPYRINLYSGNIPVGHIDGEVYEGGNFKALQTDIPYVLFTPMGKVSGQFSTHFQLYTFNIENRQKDFKKLCGLFGIKSLEDEEGFYISASINLTNLEDKNIRLSFNNLASSYQFEIVKDAKVSGEAVKLYYSGDSLIMRHIDYHSPNVTNELMNISILLDYNLHSFLLSYAFKDLAKYKKVVDVEKDDVLFMPIRNSLNSISYSLIEEEIAHNDSRMMELFNEIKEDMTIMANGTTPVSIYDKVAHLCFAGPDNKLFLDFARAKETKLAIDNNPVLKKMKK